MAKLSEDQYGEIIDLISAGEIDGLVGGKQGVYFDKSSLADNAIADTVQTRPGEGFVNNTTESGDEKAQVTAANIAQTGGANAIGLFKDVTLTTFPRYIQFGEAGGSSEVYEAITGIQAIGAADNRNTTSVPQVLTHSQIKIKKGSLTGGGTANLDPNKHKDSFNGDIWTESDINNYVKHTIRLNYANSAGHYIGRITSIAADEETYYTLNISPPIRQNVTVNTPIKADFIAKVVTKVSDTEARLDRRVPTPTGTSAKVHIRLSAPVIPYSEAETANLGLKFPSAKADVTHGKRHPEPETGARAPSVSIVYPDNTELKRSEHAGIATGGQADHIINSSQLAFGQNTAGEMDELQALIEFPAGLRHVTENGNDMTAFAEFQIIFSYKPLGSNDYTNVLVAGKDYGGDDFVESVPAWNKGPHDYKTYARELVYGYQARARYNDSSGNADYRGTTGTGEEQKTNTGIVSRFGNRPSFVVEFTHDLRAYQPFSVFKVIFRRMSPENGVEYSNDKQSFSGMSKVKQVQFNIYDKLLYPLSAIAKVGFSAKDFKTVPERAYHIKGKLVKVPTNYFTRDETGSLSASYSRIASAAAIAADATFTTYRSTHTDYVTWDGTFRGDTNVAGSINLKKVYTNNPAWIFYDILTDTDIGLGDFIKATDVDKYALYQIARYCDELVPDGKGGQEPRFTCNVYLGGREEAYKVLKDLATVFRSMMFWIDGKITLIQDSPKEPVYTFTQANIVDGVFEYTYTGQRARVNQVNVTWNNPDEFYKKTVVTIEDAANIAQDKFITSKDIVAFGCTSEAQAERLGLWHIATESKETEIVSFTTGINASFLRPGDIINVQDKHSYNIEKSGRILADGDTNGPYSLDRTVTFGPTGEVGTDCNLILIFSEPGIYLAQDSATINSVAYTRGALLLENATPTTFNPATETDAANLVDDDGNAVATHFSKNIRTETKPISNTGATSSSITITGNFSSSVPKDTIWAIQRKDTSANVDDIKKFRILSITEDNEEYSITASKYVETKFDEIEYEKPIYTTDYSVIPASGDIVPPPTNLNIELVPKDITNAEIATTFRGLVTWTPPEEIFIDSNGSSSTVPYKHLSHYKLIINSTSEDNTTPIVETRIENAASSSFFVDEITARGTYEVILYAVGSFSIASENAGLMEALSIPISIQREIFHHVPRYNKIDKIAKGGQSDALMELSDTSKVIFNKTPFSFEAPSGITYSSLTGTQEQDFNGLASGGETGYLYFDASATSHWKNMLVHTDTVIEDAAAYNINTTYLKEAGASNNGLTAITGSSITILAYLGSTEVIGVNTAFRTDFKVGDLIKLSDNSSAGTETVNSEYSTVVAIDNDYILHVNTPFTRDMSSWTIYAYKQTFLPDTEFDAILAEVVRSSGGDYTLTSFVTYMGGATDISGLNTATAYLYQVNASNTNPPADPNGDLIYNFSDATISGSNFNSWSATRPATSNTNPYRWVIAGPASAITDTDVIETGDWAGAVLDSAEGFQSATAWLYKRSASSASLTEPDNDLTWNFANGALTVADGNAAKDGWTEVIPDTGGSYIHVTTAVALAVNSATTDIIEPEDWSDPAVLAPPGVTGGGTNFIFKRNATNPNLSTGPTANGLSVPTGWDDTPGGTNSSGTAFLWASKGTVAAGGIAYSWSPSYQVVGTAVAEVRIYSDTVANNGASPNVPSTGTSKFNFTTGAIITNDDNWNITPPSVVNDGDTVYSTTAIVTGAPEETTVGITWGNGTNIFQRKTDGATGTAAYTVRLSATKYVIAYDEDGDEATESSLTFTAAPQGIVGTATYKFEVDGTQKQAAGTSPTYEMADGDEPASGAAKLVKVTMYDNDVEKATDSVSVYGIQDGIDAITIIMTNEAHAFPTTSAGTVTYDNSGTDIRVFRGSTPLAYGSGNDQFTVAAVGTTSSVQPNANPTTVSTNTRSYGIANTMATATAIITFTITVKNSLGTATPFTKIQTLNKTVDGTPSFTWIKYATNDDGSAGFTDTYEEGVTLYIGHAYNKTVAAESSNPTHYVWSLFEGPAGVSAKGLSLELESKTISFDNSTGTPVLSPSGDAQDIVVKCNLQNITGTPTYSILTSAGAAQQDLLFDDDGGDGVKTATTATIVASTWDTVTLGKSVQIKATLVDGGVTYTDTESVYVLFSGEAGAAGRKVAELALYKDHTFSGTSHDMPSAPSSGTYNFNTRVIGDTITSGWSQTKPNAASADIVFKSVTLATESTGGTTSNSLTWSVPTTDGLPQNEVNFIFKRSSATTTPAVTNYGAALPATGGQWYDNIASVPAGNGDPIWVSKGSVATTKVGSTFNYKWTWGASSQLEGTEGAEGDAAVTGYLTNENFTAPTAAGSDPVLTGGTGNMKIFLGTVDDTSNWTFAGDVANTDGMAFAVTEATGAYALSGTWEGTTASFDITATRTGGGYSNVVKTFSVSKTADGDTGSGTKLAYRNETLAEKPATPTANNLLEPTDWSFSPSNTSGSELQWVSTGTVVTGGTAYIWGPVVLNIGTKGDITDLGLDVDDFASASNYLNPTFNLSFVTSALGYTPYSNANPSGYTGDQVLPTYTSGSGVPNDNTTPSPNPLGSTYLNESTSPKTLYISDGDDWILQDVNSNTTYTNISEFTNDSGFTGDQVLPTYTSGSGVPNNNTTPSPNPLGSTYLNESTSPKTLYISDGDDWILQDVNSNTQLTIGTGAGEALAGNTSIPVDLTTEGAGTVHANNYTNSQYSASDFNITALSGYTAAAYANANVALPTFTSGEAVPTNGSAPAGSTYRRTTVPPTLYVSNGTTWTLVDVNTNTQLTIGTGAGEVLAGNTSIPVDLTIEGAGTVHADNYTDTDTVYTLPDTVPTGVSFSGGVLTVTRAAGNQTTNIPDTTYADLAALDSTANTKLEEIINVTSNVDPSYIKFNKDQTNYAPRRGTSLTYKYAANSSIVYAAGSLASSYRSWLSSSVAFYDGTTRIAVLDFIHIVDYGENASSADYAGDEIRTYWNKITAENSSGLTKTDFTVKFLVPSGTNGAIETTEIFCSEEDAATNGLASSPLEYGGDYVSYEVEVTHDSSGVVSLHRVYLETIGNTAPVK